LGIGLGPFWRDGDRFLQVRERLAEGPLLFDVDERERLEGFRARHVDALGRILARVLLDESVVLRNRLRGHDPQSRPGEAAAVARDAFEALATLYEIALPGGSARFVQVRKILRSDRFA